VLRAARGFAGTLGAALTLDKHLPVASGIGGGSADAAATLRLLARVWKAPMPSDAGLSLGADVPVCVDGRSVRMRGIGDIIDPVAALPAGLGILLVNPRVEVPTPQIFKTLASRDNAPMPDIPTLETAADFCDWLAHQRNDLQPPAISIAPVIQTVIDAIADTDCLIARMSGSGATCFGLFETVEDAKAARDTLRRAHPDWWVAASHVMGT
jgi:4-diphosphocytidyl-2-C-methyl-D-erythritol kinase